MSNQLLFVWTAHGMIGGWLKAGGHQTDTSAWRRYGVALLGLMEANYVDCSNRYAWLYLGENDYKWCHEGMCFHGVQVQFHFNWYNLNPRNVRHFLPSKHCIFPSSSENWLGHWSALRLEYSRPLALNWLSVLQRYWVEERAWSPSVQRDLWGGIFA